MSESRVKKLLEITTPSEKVELTVLFNAERTNLKNYMADSTSAKLSNWQKPKTALKEIIEKLEEKYGISEGPEENREFDSRKYVLLYLHSEGWKVSKGGFYGHCSQGKLTPNRSGKYTVKAVEKYAKNYLKRQDTGKMVEVEQETLQKEKLEVEIRKTRAQAEKAEYDLAITQGKYLPREDFELELAGRGAVLSAAMQYLVQDRVPEWISIVGGAKDKVVDLIEAMSGDFDGMLNEFATTENFQVIFKATES